MASLSNICRRIHVLKRFNPQQKSFSTAATLAAAAWNKDWKPGPYPKTPEERAAAAKKYGMLPQDYEPYPEDGTGWGDYPNIKPVGDLHKDPWQDYDFRKMRRNYGDVMHINADMYYEQAVDTTPTRYPAWMAIGFLLFVFGSFHFLVWALDPYHISQKAKPKQYPYNNLWVQRGLDPAKEPTIKHYTFEPVE